jgi:hypothetical protein
MDDTVDDVAGVVERASAVASFRAWSIFSSSLSRLFWIRAISSVCCIFRLTVRRTVSSSRLSLNLLTAVFFVLLLSGVFPFVVLAMFV